MNEEVEVPEPRMPLVIDTWEDFELTPSENGNNYPACVDCEG